MGDFEDVAEKYGVTGISCGEDFVKRKYAFGIRGIPRGETDWVEATCDFPSASLSLPNRSRAVADSPCVNRWRRQEGYPDGRVR